MASKKSLEQWKQEVCSQMVLEKRREIGLKIQDDWKNVQQKTVQMWSENERKLNNFFPSINAISSELQCELKEQKKLQQQLKELKMQNKILQESSKLTPERTQRFVRLKQMEIQNKGIADQILQYDQEIQLLEQSVQKYKKRLSTLREALKKKTNYVNELKQELPTSD